jgi:hypothetical protein
MHGAYNVRSTNYLSCIIRNVNSLGSHYMNTVLSFRYLVSFVWRWQSLDRHGRQVVLELKDLAQWVVAICVTICSDIFFSFDSSYLLLERQDCGPLRLVTQKTTIPGIYQTSENVVKGRHLMDCLSFNKMNTETAFFFISLIFNVQSLRKVSSAVYFLFLSPASDLQ